MRLAIITGGSTGLGLELCRHYAGLGFQVLEFSRSAPHAFSARVDLGAPEAGHAAIEAALAVLPDGPWEEIVAVANAASITPIGAASQQRPAAVIAALNTSFTSAILFIAAVVARFQAVPCRKTIVNVSSGAATRGQAGVSLYCASKAGLENFIRAVALEQAAEPLPFIAVNVDPGAMDTGMQVAITGSSKSDFPDVDRFIERQRNGTLRSPPRVAEALARIVALPELAGGARYNVGDYGV